MISYINSVNKLIVCAVAVLTILNPAPAILNLSCDVCQNVDIICLNETESEMITGLTVTSVDDAGTVTTVLLDRGCRTVIVTLGAQGTVFATKDATKAVHVPTRSVEAVDTTVSVCRCLLDGVADWQSADPNFSK